MNVWIIKILLAFFNPFMDNIYAQMRKTLLRKIKSRLKKNTIANLAGEIGIPYATFWRMIQSNGGSARTSIDNWEKVEKYFRVHN